MHDMKVSEIMIHDQGCWKCANLPKSFEIQTGNMHVQDLSITASRDIQ